MTYGQIITLLFIVLVLYYAGLITMDIIAAKRMKASDEAKNEEAEIDISGLLASLFTVKIVGHVEIFHLSGNLCLEVCCVKQCDGVDTAYTVYKVVPGLFCAVSKWCHCAHARYNYSFQFHYVIDLKWGINSHCLFLLKKVVGLCFHT